LLGWSLVVTIAPPFPKRVTVKRRQSQISLFFLSLVISSLSLAVGASEAKKNIPALLGWVPNDKYICGGYYQDPLAALIGQPLPPLDTTPVKIDSTGGGEFKANGTSVLTGNVTIDQPGRWVHADKVEFNRNATTGQISDATLTGHAVLREPGKVMVGDSGHVELQTKVAHFFHALYHIAISAFNPGATTPENAAQELHAWGKVQEIDQQSSGIIRLRKATYTTCAPNTLCAWQLSARKVDLNRDVGRGYAYDAWLHVKGIPVFYTPYINFPIDDRRQTGFLFPTVGSSNKSGLTVSIPYYWNIAPNYDATITPNIYSKRGVQLGGLFRYLTPIDNGSINTSFLPHDRAFANFKKQAVTQYPLTAQAPQLNRLLESSDNRGFFNWKDNANFNPHWNSTINYNYVSDDYYYQDFGGIPTLVPNQLPRQGTVNYSGDVWNFTGELFGYQTLHPINQSTITNPYFRLPELDLNGNFPDQPYGLNYQLNNQFVYFQRDRNPGELTEPMKAGRLNLQPGVSLPLTSLGGYATPNLQLALTHYNIGNQVSGYASEFDRKLPIFDIDSGLYFDRDASFGHSDYQQTLEPRLFYLYVPYRNQDNIPLFDSAIIPFSYDSLFTTNRFSGLDRIGDANQITFALTTRFLDADSGAEKFRASIGEIYYFQNRRVSNCAPAGTPASVALGTVCSNPNTVIGAIPPNEVTSPIAGQVSYQFNPSWSTTANIAWDPHIHQTVNGNWNFHYQPWPNHIINFNYNYIRFGDPISTNPPTTPPDSHKNDLDQVGFSFAWPFKMNWSAIGGLNYNRSHNYPQTYFYGLEYDSCCWAVRLVAGRAFSALNQNGNPVFNNSIYLQWQFKGLGTVGTNDPASMLMGSIPGYQDNFQSFSTFPRLAT
jgi:LPS-assembly protein